MIIITGTEVGGTYMREIMKASKEQQKLKLSESIEYPPPPDSQSDTVVFLFAKTLN